MAPNQSLATASRSASALNLIGESWFEGRGNTIRDICNPADTAELLASVREAGAGAGSRPVQVPGFAGKESLGIGARHLPRKRQAAERGVWFAAARDGHR